MNLQQFLSDLNLIFKNRYLHFLFQQDMKKYADKSCLHTSNPECLATNIRLIAHSIEKGMSLPNCRIGFGKQKIQTLIQLCYQYEAVVNRSDLEAVDVAYSVIKAYIQMQSALGADLCFIPRCVQERAQNCKGRAGVQIQTGKISPQFFREVASHRHSLRYFSTVPLAKEDIISAVSLAQTAPSACNRQATRVYAVTKPEKISKIMELHGGIRSFGKPTCIFIITNDLTLYKGEYERNTAYVDGGIFTMNLLYALDSVGIATCPAIWGNVPEDDAILSEIAGINPSHRIINLVVAGYYPKDEYRVAVSAKRSTNSILKIVN